MKYNPKDFEDEIYKFWEQNNFFKTNFKNKKDNYCIILPPPNITGNLHIGHSLQQTIMDFLIRFNRMNGKNVLWQPGIDHAGIATQILIEKKFSKFNNKKSLINKTFFWKENICKSIINQMKKLGNSIDWSNIRFTLDNKSIYSVKHAFIELYRNNLIYKKKKIVNWDISLKSVISDIEVSYKNIIGKIWYIKFLIKNENNKYIIISTTRPETILGNVAVVVNPYDYRYKDIIGKYVIIPIINKIVPIISDKSIDINFGSGCMQLSSGHSLNDFNISIKNNLPIVNIFTLNGKIKKYAEVIYNINSIKNINIEYFKIPNYLKNIKISEAKNKILKILYSLDLILKEEELNINVPYNKRSKSIIEYMITDQWYLNTKKLSKNAINIVKNKYIKFFPLKYKKMYIDSMKNIEDWCISRQIWWGHKIPAWYDKNKNIYVGLNRNDIKKFYNIDDNIKLYKDKNVLDTWFSSSLWTFISLGWPKNISKVNLFHPTDIIVSGHDIMFFWISRMIMLTIFLIKNNDIKKIIPFKNIYITGLINDENGKKMSKSNGNIIDPIDIINGITLKNLIKKIKKEKNIDNEYINKIKIKFKNGIESCGADSLRMFFLSFSNDNKNINFDIKKVYNYKNFCNKLWNASNFIIKNCNNINLNDINLNNIKLFFNKWIISIFNKLIYKINIYIENYKFDYFINEIYNFFWNIFCNTYLEISKFYILKNKNNYIIAYETKLILIYLLKKILKILHPVIPFITEKIWQNIINIFKEIEVKNKKTISLQRFPEFKKKLIKNKIEKKFNIIKKIIIFLRKEKNKINKEYYKNISFFKKNIKYIKIFNKNKKLINFLIKFDI